MDLKSILPLVLATINVSTIAALSGGYLAIRRGRGDLHRKCMLVAVGLGAAFLGLYLLYHFGAGLAKFGGHGIVRPVYFSILILHIVAAAISAPLVLLVFYRALSGHLRAHRRLALRAWGTWMFVATSGIVVYVMVVHVWPYQGPGP